jgi:hypothetical protein
MWIENQHLNTSKLVSSLESKVQTLVFPCIVWAISALAMQVSVIDKPLLHLEQR